MGMEESALTTGAAITCAIGAVAGFVATTNAPLLASIVGLLAMLVALGLMLTLVARRRRSPPMSRDRRAIDLLFTSGIAAAGASAALFGVMVIVQAVPNSSVPVLSPLRASRWCYRP